MLATRPAMGRTGGWRVMRSGPSHPQWKGQKVKYGSLHDYVRYHKGSPQRCVDCAATENLEWSNIDGWYTRDLDMYVARCRRCHARHDRQPHMFRAAIRRFGGKP